MQTFSSSLLTPGAPPQCSPVHPPLQPGLNRNPSKAVTQTWQCARSPERGQHHPRVTPAPGRREENYTYQFHFGSSSELGVDIWPACSPAHQQKLLRGQQRRAPYNPMLLRFWSMTGLTKLKPKVAPEWPTNNTGTKPCLQQAEGAIVDTYTEGKCSSATIIGSGELGTFHCRALQDLFFIVPLLSRAGDVVNFLNIQKQTQS